MFLRGFASRTLEARRQLATIARRIHETPELLEIVAATPAERLYDVLAAEPAAHEVLADLDEHLARYGHLVYNLDFVEPTLAEQPLPVLQSLRVLATDPEALARAAADRVPEPERETLVRDTAAALGPMRRWLFSKALAKARELGPYREEALFYMGAAWPVLRRLALELGGRLVAAGTLGAADGVFYLRTSEFEAACAALASSHPCPDLGNAADSRRALREARKRLHPPGRVPQDLRFKLGPFDVTELFAAFETQKRNAGDADTLCGFAVSPGRVTGVASVIRSPAEFAAMQPGNILVCPATTPAWTPLFSQAIGLVTDIGAVLAHGSIVAREYGIPAVLGTGNATRRVANGDVLTIDGSAGTVVVHD
jgi:pyruvate,water dikinase